MGVQIFGPDGEPARVSRYGGVGVAQVAKHGNHFMGGYQSGIMPAGLSADIELFQMRWVNTDWMALIDSVVLSLGNSTAFTAGFLRFDLTRATGWSAQGTGGASLGVASPFGKLDTAQDATRSASGDLRVATTAGLGAGTKTLDTQFLSSVDLSLPNVAGSNPGLIASLWSPLVSDHPIILRANEGIVVRGEVPATGVWQFSVNVKWREMLLTDYVS